MRFNKSLAAAGALGLAVLTASPALADTPTDTPIAPLEAKAPEAPAETQQPVETEKPADKPVEKPSERPSERPSTKPETKPESKPTQSATPKPTATKTPEKKEVEQKGSISLSASTAKPGDIVTVSVTSTREAITAITSRGFDPSSWNVPGKRLEYRFQVRVSKELGRHAVDAHFADGSSARAVLTVEQEEAPSIEPRFGLSTYEVKAGGEVTADIVGDLKASEVIFSSDLFGTKHMQLKDIGDGRGRATFSFPVPANTKAGSYAVRADLSGYGKPVANLKVIAPSITEPRLGMSSYELKPGQTVTIDAVGNLDAGQVIFSSDLFDTKHMQLKDIGDGLGRATYQVTVPSTAKAGSYTMRADFNRYGKATGSFKVVDEAPVNYGISVSPSAANPGDKVTYTVTGKAADAYIESTAFWAKITENMTLGTTRTGTVPIDPAAKPGPHRVSVVFKDAAGRTVGTAATTITVKGPVKPVPVTGLYLDLSPSTIVAGQSYYAGISTRNVKAGTPVTITDPGGKRHVVRVDSWGEAHIRLTSPKSARPGKHTVTATLPSGQSHSATLTVVKRHPHTQLALILDPNKVYAGGKFTAILATSSFGKTTKATITDPSGKRFTVKIGKSGVGAKKFHVPSSTKAGTYWFKAKLANGATDWAKLTVKSKYRASNLTLTPKGGAATGGGLPEGNPNFAGVALGGLMLTGGAGTALFARRRTDEV